MRTTRTWGLPKISTELSLSKCNKNSILHLTGILGNHLLAPWLLSKRLDCANYFLFLQQVLPAFMHRILATVCQIVWSMHDGTPAHFTIAACNPFDTTYPVKWIEHVGPIVSPPHFPDLNTILLFGATSIKLLNSIAKLWINWRIWDQGSLSLHKTSPAHQVCVTGDISSVSVGWPLLDKLRTIPVKIPHHFLFMLLLMIGPFCSTLCHTLLNKFYDFPTIRDLWTYVLWHFLSCCYLLSPFWISLSNLAYVHTHTYIP